MKSQIKLSETIDCCNWSLPFKKRLSSQIVTKNSKIRALTLFFSSIQKYSKSDLPPCHKGPIHSSRFIHLRIMWKVTRKRFGLLPSMWSNEVITLLLHVPNEQQCRRSLGHRLLHDRGIQAELHRLGILLSRHDRWYDRQQQLGPYPLR